MTEAELLQLRAEDFDPEARDANAAVARELRKLQRDVVNLSYEQERWMGRYQLHKRKPGRPPRVAQPQPDVSVKEKVEGAGEETSTHAPPLDLKVEGEPAGESRKKEGPKKAADDIPPPSFLKKLNPDEIGAMFAAFCIEASEKLPAEWPRIPRQTFPVIQEAASYLVKKRMPSIDTDPETAAAVICVGAAGYPAFGHAYVWWEKRKLVQAPKAERPPAEDSGIKVTRIK